jgi:HrpA-like RNA helicase
LESDPDARIICTQPRRLAAINIARRVASEMGEGVGYTVGYHVGMANRFHTDTKILFVTTGIFLQRLVNDASFLDSWTHVILDEVHE